MTAPQKRMVQHTAGLGDPYWYEWSVGLTHVVDLLDPSGDVTGVTLQRSGTKGLDDVVVTFASGRARFIQVKHTRSEATLTFGDLVTPDGDSPSLLAAMATAWLTEGKPAEVWLVTNRAAGTTGRTVIGSAAIYRPALAEFLPWLASSVVGPKGLADFPVPPKWKDAWNVEWLSQLSMLQDQDKLSFMRALDVRHSEVSLDEIREQLTNRIADLFDVTPEVALGLRARLDSALRTWATSSRGPDEVITKEKAYATLCLTQDVLVGEHDLPPPAPFFPTRLPILQELSRAISVRDAPILFVAGEPGSGKTAVLSALSSQRDSVVGVRFHAYRPITPENQLLPADAGRTTTARALWSDILIQMRAQLRGKLAALKVPVHAGSLTVERLRAHVLRIAQALGEQQSHPFAIVIDGIDHAARAGASTESFLSSLVPPLSVPPNVIFILGGQPGAAYPQYPRWLRVADSGVQGITLPRLSTTDTRVLIDAQLPNVSPAERVNLTRDIAQLCDGNTLATVFAIEEASAIQTDLSQFTANLQDRKLSAGIEAYYDAIWTAATPGWPTPTTARLAACLTLLPTRTTAETVAAVVSNDRPDALNFADVLRRLRPLVVEDAAGFRVFHNDVRVFLLRVLQAEPEVYRECASILADRLLVGSDIAARHAATQNLLGIAERWNDQARLLTPAYVLEANSIHRPLSAITEQAAISARALAKTSHDWDLVHVVATGLRTLAQLRASLEWRDATEHDRSGVVHTLPSERRVPPSTDWTRDLVSSVLDELAQLVRRGELERARGAFLRWFRDLSPRDIQLGLASTTSAPPSQHSLPQNDATLTKLGFVGTQVHVTLRRSADADDGAAEASYTRGLLDGLPQCDSELQFVSILGRISFFVENDIATLFARLVEARQWRRLGLVLQRFSATPSSSWPVQIHGVAAAALLGDQKLWKKWGSPFLKNLKTKVSGALSCGSALDDGQDPTTLICLIAMTAGIEDPWRDPSNIRHDIETIYSDLRGQDRLEGIAPLLHASALLGTVIRKARDANARPLAVDVDRVTQTVSLLVKTTLQPAHRVPVYRYSQIASAIVRGFFDAAERDAALSEALVAVVLPHVEAGNALGPFLSTVWTALARVQKEPELARYADRWLGTNGCVWSEAPADRHALVESLATLLDDIGHGDIAAEARLRLAWADIGYVGHKEYVLRQPIDWFEAVASRRPDVWESSGLRLLSISHEASRTGANKLSPEVERAVATAASLDGAASLASLVLGDTPVLPVGDPAIVDGVLARIRERSMTRPELLATWAFCTGQLCWQLDDDHRRLAHIREAIADAAARASEPGVQTAMQTMSPAEFACEASRDTSYDGTPAPSYDELTPTEAIRASVAAADWRGLRTAVSRARREAEVSAESVTEAWAALRTRRQLPWWYDRADDAFSTLFPLLTDGQRWEAVEDAVTSDSREATVETLTLADNLDDLCRLWASCQDGDALQRGLDRLLDMHELWIMGGGRLPQAKAIRVVKQTAVQDWGPLYIEALLRLLEFDELSYIQTALRGIARLLTLDAALYGYAIPRLKRSERDVQRRFLWIVDALVGEESADPLRVWLSELLNSARLDMALSAWWALRLGHRMLNRDAPSWPEPEPSGASIVVAAPPLLDAGPSQRGLRATAARASSSKLQHLELACASSIDDLKAAFAASVRHDPPASRARRKRKRVFSDIVHDPNDDAELDRLNELLRQQERRGRFVGIPLIRLAQAMMPGVDPFVFLRTPEVHPSATAWPSEEDLDHALGSPAPAWAKVDDIAEGLDPKDDARLASRPESPEQLYAQLSRVLEADLPASARLLAGSVSAFSSGWDVEVWMTHAVGRRVLSDDDRPLTLNARSSLLYDDPEALIPDPSGSPNTWIAQQVFGLFVFPDEYLDAFPTPAWRTRLGWSPSRDNPLIWQRDGKRVAWFERLRGPMRHIYPRDFSCRQPLVARWVCSDSEWIRLQEELGTAERVTHGRHAAAGIYER